MRSTRAGARVHGIHDFKGPSRSGGNDRGTGSPRATCYLSRDRLGSVRLLGLSRPRNNRNVHGPGANLQECEQAGCHFIALESRVAGVR